MMPDSIQQVTASVLMHEMRLDGANIERRHRIVGIEPGDLVRIAAVKDVVTRHMKVFVASYFDHLSGLEEARPLLGNHALSDRARQLKQEHLLAMVQGEYGRAYVEQWLEIGLLNAKIGLDPRVFLGAYQSLLKSIGVAVMKQSERSPVEGFENFMALQKIAYFDISLMLDILAFERERIIRQQQEAIRELSTPVLQIRARMLLLPIIGVIDTHRARLITESLLRAIRDNRAQAVVMDVTGVATIDSKVANHLLQTVTAARLMGAAVIVTGLSSEVAQSLVTLGIELHKLNTVGDLQGGLEEAERMLGYRVVRGMEAGAAAPVTRS